MDVMYQAMDQMLRSAGTQRSAPQQRREEPRKSPEGRDFGSMVREKRQATGNASPQRTDARPQAAEEEPSDEQYAMAAMMLQPIPTAQMNEPAPEAENAAGSLFFDALAEAAQSETVPGGLANLAEAPVETESGNEAEVLPVFRFQAPAGTGDAAEEQSGDETAEELPVETPVFEFVDAAPVKVADSLSEPLALEQPEAPNELAARIESLITAEDGSSRVELTLTPASLGKISVEITHSADGALHIALSAANPKAMALLERQSGSLHQLLSNQNRPSVEIEIRRSPDAPQQFLNPNDDNARQQQRQQQQHRPRREEPVGMDFVQRLRLGLVELAGVGTA